MDFYDLDLHDDVLDALDDMNFIETTPIQEHAIPAILDGRDIIGVAQTGTGKTAAFLLPVLSKLSDGGYPTDAVNCVIMSPTRELAQQIDQAMQGFSYHMPNISSIAIYGGNDGIRYAQEKRGMEMGADVIIATPGRLISHISLGNVDLSRATFFILDEADRMLDMGFADDIMQIEKQMTNPKRQTIMFSATMPHDIQQLAKTILHDPLEIKLAVTKPADGIHQSAYICYEAQKLDILRHILTTQQQHRVIIFAGSKLKVKDIDIALRRDGHNCRAMHSDLDQSQRDQAMQQFKARHVDILVATDIVARGIDIDDIQLVINYDTPRDVEDYVHRIGRTARAGAQGQAITLVDQRDQPHFARIERFLQYNVPQNPLPQHLGQAPQYNHTSTKPHHNKHNHHHKHNHHAKQTTTPKAKTNPHSKSHTTPQTNKNPANTAPKRQK